MTKERNAQGEVVKLTVILRSASAGFTVEDFSYAWYGVKDGTEVRLSASGATLEKDQFAGYESFKVVAQSSAFSGLSAELATNVSGRTVYLSMGAGDDNNSGFEPAKPVATFQKAYTLLKDCLLYTSQFKEDFGCTVEAGLPVEMAFMRAAGAFDRDDADEVTLTPRGRYLMVVMMRQFFIGVNNLRDQARAALVGEERELIFGE